MWTRSHFPFFSCNNYCTGHSDRVNKLIWVLMQQQSRLIWYTIICNGGWGGGGVHLGGRGQRGETSKGKSVLLTVGSSHSTWSLSNREMHLWLCMRGWACVGVLGREREKEAFNLAKGCSLSNTVCTTHFKSLRYFSHSHQSAIQWGSPPH